MNWNSSWVTNAYALSNPQYATIGYRTDDSEPNTWGYGGGTNSKPYICMFAEVTPKYEDLTTEIITVTESTEEQNYENPGVSLQLPHFEPALTDQLK